MTDRGWLTDRLNIPSPGEEPRGWKSWAESELNRIRASVPPGSPLAPSDEQFVHAMYMLRHPKRTKVKDHCRWYVRRDESGWPRFEQLLEDGTFSPIAWRKLITVPAHEELVRRAMRQAVRLQIEEFRNSSLEALCPLCQAIIRCDDAIHVDHEIPFRQLAGTFSGASGGWDCFTVNEDGDRPVLTEPLITQWRVFHKAVARLRLVHAACNLSRSPSK